MPGNVSDDMAKRIIQENEDNSRLMGLIITYLARSNGQLN